MLHIIILFALVSPCFFQEEPDYMKPKTWLVDKLKFMKFKHKFNKNYTCLEEEKRFEIFSNNLRVIQKHNEKYELGTETWEMGIGPFADLTEQEFVNKFRFDEDLARTEISVYCRNSSRYLPYIISHNHLLGQAKDQRNCNAGWAFAVVATAEAMLARRNIRLSLSEQNLIDCAYGYDYDAFGCSGGKPQGGLIYMASEGITISRRYPFENTRNRYCRKNCILYTFYATNICRVGTTEYSLKSAVAKAPVVMEIEVTPTLMHYRRGIIRDMRPCPKYKNHAVSVIGYGDGFWLLRNSWGPFWGEDGNYMWTTDSTFQCDFGRNAFSFGVKRYWE